ncbi:MAG: polyprenyl synthetase family protein [Bacteroidales bacterium]
MYNHSELKEVVDKALKNLSYNSEASRLTDPVKYILSIGGKRLRPVLALMACNFFSDTIDEAVLPAIGLEIFHNFTLVHDDIMDDAPVRRSFPTVHAKWDTKQAILSGDVMAFIANDCVMQAPADKLLKVFKVYNKAAIEVCIGQQLDMDYEKAAIVSQEEYLRMIELKTAVLIAAAVKTGAVIGGADDRDSELLYDFGRNLGLAFQVQDDLLDVWGETKVFGKTQGGDIVANKKTFPLVKAMETATGMQLKHLQELFSESETDPETKVRKVIELYEQLNIREITETLAYDYINKAFDFLQKVSVDELRKKEMTNLAISLIGRDH